MKKKRVNLTMDEKVYKDLQKRAIDENLSVSQLLENLAVDYLSKTKKNALYPHE